MRSAFARMTSLTSSTIKWAILPAALFSFGAVSVPAEAQEGEQARARIDQVTVTARKREELSQTVPLAMTALTGEIQKPTVRDLSDLNGFSANVRIEADQSRGGGININIRGINPVRTDDNSFDAPIAVMIDGVHLGILSGQLLENFDLERVEILRGPQGTLFGKNTVGGVVNVIRSRPTGEWGAKLQYSFGKWNQQEVRGVFNVPMVEDKLAFKGFFTYQKDDGYIYNTNLDRRQPTTDYMNFGGTFLFTPGEDFEALITVERFHDDGEGGGNLTNWNVAAGVVPAPANPDLEPNFNGGFILCNFGIGPCRTDVDSVASTVNGNGNPARLRTTAITAQLTWDVSDNHRLVSITGYRKVSEDRLLDFDGTSAEFIFIDRDNDYKQFSQEVRWEGTFGDTFNITAGAYYWRSEFEQDWVTSGSFWGVAAPLGLEDNSLGLVGACQAGVFAPLYCDPHPSLAGGLGDGFAQVLNEEQVTKSLAFFAQADWEFVENWTLTAGIRWTEEKKTFGAAQAYLTSLARSGPDLVDGIAASLPGACGTLDPAVCSNGFATLGNKWTEVSPKIGISWQVTDDVMIFASYSEGFHSGGFFGVNQNIRDFVRDQYDPEYAKTWEVGLKSQFFDNTLQLNLTLFRNNFDNKQESNVVQDPDTGTVVTQFYNAASARYQGIEAEVQWVVTENLNLFGSLGFLDAGYKEFLCDRTPNNGVFIEQDCSDLNPRSAPKWTFGVGGSLSIPVGNEGEIELYAKYSYVDNLDAGLINAEFNKVSSRGDLSISGAYAWRNYRLTVYGKNLTNDIFEIPFPIDPLFASGTIIPGRSWGVQIDAEF